MATRPRTPAQRAALAKAQKASAAKRKSGAARGGKKLARDGMPTGGMSLAQIAKETGVSVATVRRKIAQDVAGSKLSAAEVARRKKERPFDLAYQAGQVSREDRVAEGGSSGLRVKRGELGASTKRPSMSSAERSKRLSRGY